MSAIVREAPMGAAARWGWPGSPAGYAVAGGAAPVLAIAAVIGAVVVLVVATADRRRDSPLAVAAPEFAGLRRGFPVPGLRSARY